MRLEQCFRQVLDGLPENPLIRDFDVLFNPAYEVDILRIMTSIGKNKPFQVVWPGKYEDGRLLYAEEGYRDYKVYDLDKYYPFSSLNEFPFLFPFSYKVTKEQLLENEDFTLATFDSTLSVSLKNA